MVENIAIYDILEIEDGLVRNVLMWPMTKAGPAVGRLLRIQTWDFVLHKIF